MFLDHILPLAPQIRRLKQDFSKLKTKYLNTRDKKESLEIGIKNQERLELTRTYVPESEACSSSKSNANNGPMPQSFWGGNIRERPKYLDELDQDMPNVD